MRKAYLPALVLSTLVLLGCTAPATSVPSIRPEEPSKIAESPTEQPVATATAQPTEKALAATEAVQPTAQAAEAPATQGAPQWKADGAISEGEYAHETTIGGVHLWWRNDAQYLYLVFEAKTNGWVAVGLDPERRMKGANYLIGMISNGQVKVVDAYGTAETGATHPADEDLGGKNDIVAFAGVQEGGVTRFEVQIPLDSGDKYDKPLKPGQSYAVITGLSGSAQFNAPHSSRSSGQIALDAAK